MICGNIPKLIESETTKLWTYLKQINKQQLQMDICFASDFFGNNPDNEAKFPF
jgi:hypothetical protein